MVKSERLPLLIFSGVTGSIPRLVKSFGHIHWRAMRELRKNQYRCYNTFFPRHIYKRDIPFQYEI